MQRFAGVWVNILLHTRHHDILDNNHSTPLVSWQVGIVFPEHHLPTSWLVTSLHPMDSLAQGALYMLLPSLVGYQLLDTGGVEFMATNSQRD